MSLTTHARNELERAGLFDDDSDYGGMLGDAVLVVVEVFSKQGHSGFSAAMTIDILSKVLSYKVLTPITSDPNEWNDVSGLTGEPMWQSARQPDLFSKDGGKTWYSVND